MRQKPVAIQRRKLTPLLLNLTKSASASCRWAELPLMSVAGPPHSQPMPRPLCTF